MGAQLYKRKLRGPISVAALCAIGAVASLSVLAQAPAGRPGAVGGGRQGGRGGGMGFGRLGLKPSAATTPLAALTAELKLTDKQQSQIKTIQDKMMKDMMATRPAGGPGGPGGGPGGPRPGGPNPGRPGGPGGGPGGPGGGGGRFAPLSPADLKKMQDISAKANSSIEAVLTPAQKKELPGALKEIGTLRNAGIPFETLGELKLTSTQKTKIASITDKAQKDMAAKFTAANGNFQSLRTVMQDARTKTHADVMTTLTPTQKAVIDKYEKDHPRRGFGGPGGGGGRRGGPGGPGGPGGRPGA